MTDLNKIPEVDRRNLTLIYEEYDEKAWAGRDAMKYEIKAVGAMALRFMVDL